MALETQAPVMNTLDNPFAMSNVRGIIPPTPPMLPSRQLPLGPLGGVNPALAAAISAWQNNMAAQRANQAAAPATPGVPAAPVAAPVGPPSGFWQNLAYRTAQEKFNRGLPTPLADRLGWSAGWGTRPLGMQQNQALPPQAAMPTPQSFAAPIGIQSGGADYGQMAAQSQIGMEPSNAKNKNIGSVMPGY